MTSRERGIWGEDEACRYLQSKGFSVLERNYHSRFGEIYIIADDCGCLVFVEVKTRKSKSYGYACEYVTESKMKKIILTAEAYLGNVEYPPVRFDVVEIYYFEADNCLRLKSINHIENAFSAEGC